MLKELKIVVTDFCVEQSVHVTYIPHVNFVKCGQHSVGVLCFLQTGGDLETHAVHLDTLLSASAGNFSAVISWRYLITSNNKKKQTNEILRLLKSYEK